MSLKGQNTRADYIDWNDFQSLIVKLERDDNRKFALLYAIGGYCGLRVSDLTNLKWSTILNCESFSLTEQKTGKERKITIHPHLQEIIKRNYSDQPLDEFVFINRYGTRAINRQYINRTIKKIMKVYKIAGQYTSHSLRKTFGRRIWQANEGSERALIMLSEIFNHTSIQTTKIYLGIRDEEIEDVYLNL